MRNDYQYIKILKQSVRNYIREINNIYRELYFLKENYSRYEQQLLLEGFWDGIRSAAKGAGKFLGKTAANIKNFGEEVWDKGVSMGKKLVEVSKEFINKVNNAIDIAIDAIKKAPNKIWSGITDLCASISSEVSEIYLKAKEKGKEFLELTKQTISEIYKNISSKIVNAAKNTINWAKNNVEEFVKMVQEKKKEILEIANQALNSADENIKLIGTKISEAFKKSIPIAKNIALFTLGLVTLPFYGSYLFAKKTYELGEDTVQWIKDGVTKIATELPTVWEEFKKSAVEEYEKTAKSSQVTAQTESKIIKSYMKFVNERKYY